MQTKQTHYSILKYFLPHFCNIFFHFYRKYFWTLGCTTKHWWWNFGLFFFYVAPQGAVQTNFAPMTPPGGGFHFELWWTMAIHIPTVFVYDVQGVLIFKTGSSESDQQTSAFVVTFETFTGKRWWKALLA